MGVDGFVDPGAFGSLLDGVEYAEIDSTLKWMAEFGG
jgi:hypothetical protein